MYIDHFHRTTAANAAEIQKVITDQLQTVLLTYLFEIPLDEV